MRLLDQLVSERAEISETQTGVVTRAADEARDLTDSEDQNLCALKSRAEKLDERIAELRSIQVANLEAAALRAEVAATDDGEHRSAITADVVVKSEPVTYDGKNGNSFFTDMFRSQTLHDHGASERLARHAAENEALTRADGTTGNYAGLVVPAYLTDLAVEKAQAGRPTANAVRSLPLPPDGMSVNLSRVTTSSSAAVQASENATVSETTIDDTLMTFPVVTIAGMQNLSRQAVDRGSGIDQLIFEDLSMSYATALDANVVNGDGTGGASTGIYPSAGNYIDVDDASPTASETYQQLVKTAATVTENVFLPPDLIIMHPRRAAYIAAGVDSSLRPLFGMNVATSSNTIGQGDAFQYGTAAFSVAGIPVITDANIPTNLGAGGDEDVALAIRTDDCILWEVPGTDPAFVQYDSVGSSDLTVRMVAFGYSAFGVRRPASVAGLIGTLMAATL
jgi:HK97 family phage major capsid protein